MTINELQHSLINEIEELTKDMSTMNGKGNAARMKGYHQSIPILPALETIPYEETIGEEVDEASQFPYFVVRISDVEYQAKDPEPENRAHVFIAFAIFDDDTELRGYFTLTAIMERVIHRFQKNTVLDCFYCEKDMSLAFQEDDTYPQFFGGIEMIWHLPEIETEEIY